MIGLQFWEEEQSWEGFVCGIRYVRVSLHLLILEYPLLVLPLCLWLFGLGSVDTFSSYSSRPVFSHLQIFWLVHLRCQRQRMLLVYRRWEAVFMNALCGRCG
ncbi:hypothetical protein Taro_038807 [Colocasia esculenta]|uniref:Uncharacterized protein n=1 Tax=Colocasia esculenta TaxID=4460 RepID=A0A843WKB7_COLES|nr:hypothetical protein [Colocasia esculenta]